VKYPLDAVVVGGSFRRPARLDADLSGVNVVRPGVPGDQEGRLPRMATADWLTDRAAVLVTRLGDHGLVIEPGIAREIISKRVLELGDTMGISAVTASKYVTDEAIEDIALAMAEVMAPEAPGVDLTAAPRSASLSPKLLGRTISGLAEAVLLFQQHPEIHASGDRIRELTEHLSILGAMISDSPSAPSVKVPPELLGRVAGRLDAAAAEPAASEALVAAWRRDAMRLRASM
jgi:hypothetical protein